MPFTQIKCPQCGKIAEGVRTFTIGERTVTRLKCEHLISAEHLHQTRSFDTIISMDGKRLFPYQKKGGQFLLDSGGCAILGDEMGVGKMVQTLATLAVAADEMMPFLAIVKSSITKQWQHESMRWIGEDTMIQVIDSANEFILPGMHGYVVSYDLVPRLMGMSKPRKAKKQDSYNLEELVPVEPTTKPSFVERMHKCKVKTVVLDECQQIKNTEATRTMAVRMLCKEFPHRIATSGTPIKNSASEFFPVLNIVKPEMFPVYSRFLMNDCDTYMTGYGAKTGGLRDPIAFAEKTCSFYLRRTREEVLPELPKIQRNYTLHEMGAAVEKAYIAEFTKFRDEYNSMDDDADFAETGNILAYLSRMRHIVGLSKVDPCLDHCMEFLGSSDRKITIFFHHKDVGDMLFTKLSTLMQALELSPPLRIIAEMSPEQRFDTVNKFTSDPLSRVLIASTLAAGEGLNLQVCSEFIILERQWNPANEEQAEARFPRPGQQASSINGTYFVAVGTVDEFFSEIVEQKREIMHSTLDGKVSDIPWDQSSLMKELTQTLAASGGKKWSI